MKEGESSEARWNARPRKQKVAFTLSMLEILLKERKYKKNQDNDTGSQSRNLVHLHLRSRWNAISNDSHLESLASSFLPRNKQMV